MRRQHLDERVPREGWLDVVKDHVAIHAQVMSAAELTLNARVEDLGRDDIRDALWTQRTLVKTWAMRGTLRLVGLFDPYVLSITRTAVPLLSIERRPEVSRTAGWISACVLVDGVIAGTWTYQVRGGQLALDVAAWRKLSASERRQLTAEADRIGRFLDAAPRVTMGQA